MQLERVAGAGVVKVPQVCRSGNETITQSSEEKIKQRLSKMCLEGRSSLEPLEEGVSKSNSSFSVNVERAR